MSQFLWFMNLFVVYLHASSLRSFMRIQMGCFLRLGSYLKAELGVDLLPRSFRIIGKILFFKGYWSTATLTFLLHGPIHRAAQNITAVFSQQVNEQEWSKQMSQSFGMELYKSVNIRRHHYRLSQRLLTTSDYSK